MCKNIIQRVKGDNCIDDLNFWCGVKNTVHASVEVDNTLNVPVVTEILYISN